MMMMMTELRGSTALQKMFTSKWFYNGAYR